MDGLAYALRILGRHRRYTALAVLTLAAGIGVTAAMFGLLDALYFRPLPLTEQHRLVDLALVSPDPEMYVYVPYAQNQQSFGLLLVETDVDSSAAVAPIRRQIAAVDPKVPVLTVSSIANHMDLLLYDDRRNAWIGFAVGMLALTLGAVGIYGVVSLVTARRAKEMGIRVALGAERGQLLRLLLGKGAALAATGGVVGIGGGLAAGRLLRGQLHDVSPADPWSFVLGTALLVTVAMASSFTPAWRASRVDPARALRDE